ncbi:MULTISPECIES: MarR family winged helix-turn-helix transcriptional regulator [Exiguobacterium]|uniref:MarR family transcriptional regulator n=1 Tax=Exiguobacterium antarcticum TaxID=132920 RepID=A0ABT6R074_9BACL|nr:MULTISPECIES: MarR family transcriptional regulator [Exiguobacterium]MCT4779939.1 MarR family transcriptional regulator [Exiguobacterium soli]MDI3234250.1 MarR family transcriptional regulator [Exiguobacterium antarcticum]
MKEADWSLGMQLSRSYHSFKRAATKRMAEHDLTPEQFSVLSELHKQEGISQKQLALFTERDQTTVGKILDKLVKKELVIRSADPRDRRAFILLTTKAGAEVIRMLEPTLGELQQQAFSGLSKKEIKHFIKTLETIHKNVT